MGQMIEFQRPDGQTAKGYLAEAANPVGAVVVIQEWWGLNDQIRGVAQRFASAGFTALVPDLYRGQSTVEAEEAHHLMTGLNFGDAASQDIAGAVQALKARQIGSGKVGITGYCMGGRTSFVIAGKLPDRVAAAMSFHGGGLVTDADDSPHLRVDQISAVVYVGAAENDGSFTAEQGEILDRALTDAGVDHTVEFYPAAHGFAVPDNVGAYDESAAQRHWDAMERVFGAALK